MAWLKKLKNPGKRSELLKNHTTFKIGGPAGSFFRPSGLRELGQIVQSARQRAIKVLVLGAGSNILVSDQGVRAAVIKLDRPAFGKIKNSGDIVEVGAGKTLSGLLAYCRARGLSGLEFAAGIPGTVGGALAMNAGVSRRAEKLAIGDFVESVRVLDYNSNIKVLKRNQLRFKYRQSNLAKYIILSASFKLIPRSKLLVQNDIAGYLARRRSTQDYSYPNAGCVFKNPGNDSAGRLIDACGLKGAMVGAALVSRKHANFILNAGNASAKDVLDLIKLVKKEVKRKYNIVLEPEIKVWK